MPDSSRVDCVTDEYAIEVDFATKWAEAIGQSTYYARITNKKPGILLIMENPAHDKVFWLRLEVAIQGRDVKVWVINN